MPNEAAEILDKATSTPPSEAGQVLDKGLETKDEPRDEKVSSKLEILIRREQAALERERFAKQRELDLDSRLRKISEFEEAKSNPKKALELLGLNYDELTQSMLSDGEIPPQVQIQRLKEEIESFKNSHKQEKDKELEERQKFQKDSEEKAIADFKGEIKQYATENKDRYELITFEKAEELVFDVVDEYYRRTVDEKTGLGKVMSVKEACDKVEEHLEKKYNDSRGLNKVKAFWASIPKEAQNQLIEKSQQQKDPSKPVQKTLTNNLASAISQKSSRPPEDRRIEQIVQAFRSNRGI